MYNDMTIEQLGDNLFELREQIRGKEAEKTALQKEFDDVEYHMIQKMEAAGLASAGISRCTFTLKAAVHPQVKDLVAFVRWAAENDKAEMLQRRISSAVFAEYFEQNNMLPDGVDTYEKMTLGMRKR